MIRFSSFLMIIALCMIAELISLFMIERYMWKRKLIPRWKIITGFSNPVKDFAAYITSTKQEYGHVGIWIKILFGSFILMIVIGILMAIFKPE